MNAPRLALVIAALLLGAFSSACESPPLSPSASERTPLAIPSVFTPPPGAPTYVPPPTPTPAPTASPDTRIPPSPSAADYVIAQDYCASVGTVDEFDSRYTGAVPQMLIPWHYWRCMDGNLMECSGWGGSGFLHCAQLDFSEAPEGPMAKNCREEGRIIQWAYVSTLGYIWDCLDGVPVTVGRKEVDTRGFGTAVWRTVPRGIPFSDPFSHCRAYGSDDRGDDHYRYPFGSFGPAVPEPGRRLRRRPRHVALR